MQWSSLLMLLWLFMNFKIAHFGGCNGATVCILIHWQLSAPIRKSSPIHSCTCIQNDKSTSSTSWSHFYRGDADHVCQRWACFVFATHEINLLRNHWKYVHCVKTLHSVHISNNVKIYFESCIPQILLASERGRRSNTAGVANKSFAIDRPIAECQLVDRALFCIWKEHFSINIAQNTKKLSINWLVMYSL